MARRGAARFTNKLREALFTFKDGVHELGPPATELPPELPEPLRELYRFADGLWLFDDLVRIVPLAELRKEDRLWRYGHSEGVQLCADDEGRAHELDEDGDRILLADRVEDDLVARVAREGLLIDSDGEWREVFEPDGELSPAVKKKRNDLALRRVPGSPRWLLEGAELALELDGDPTPLLVQAAEGDPEAPSIAELYGLILSGRGERVEGAAQLVRAAETSGASRQAERAAIAAEASARAGDDGARARMAELAIEREPGIGARLSGEAEQALAAGRMEDGDRLAALARAIGEVSAKLRIRDRLRPLR
jgi:hypothetical protein